jgi:hypothetical protein
METIDDITIAYEEEGETLVEELDKVVLQRGVWAVVLFRYRERSKKNDGFDPPKAAIRRYQKYKGAYRKKDAVNLSYKSAGVLIGKLSEWIKDGLLGEVDTPEE